MTRKEQHKQRKRTYDPIILYDRGRVLSIVNTSNNIYWYRGTKFYEVIVEED